MTDGQTQQVVVTFDPPQVGDFDSQITLAGSTFGTAAVIVNATAVNNLEGSSSGTNQDNSEWIVYPENTWQFLGSRDDEEIVFKLLSRILGGYR